MSEKKRGSGTCSSCGEAFNNRWKPVNCGKCGLFLGGNYEPQKKAKKMKVNCPSAVLIAAHGQQRIYSVQTSSRDDRCLVVFEGETCWCSLAECKTARATFVASNIAVAFSCAHSKKCNDAVNPQVVYTLEPSMIEIYRGDKSAKEDLTNVVNDRPLHFPIACKVSDVSYAGLGPLSTNNTTGYVHVKQSKTRWTCSSKDTKCTGFAAKAKQEKAKKTCVHMHILLCIGVMSTAQPEQGETGSIAQPEQGERDITASATSSQLSQLCAEGS